MYIIDINECVLGISGCTHGCRNDVGSYHCICETGYELSYDNHSCFGKLFHKLVENSVFVMLQILMSVIKTMGNVAKSVSMMLDHIIVSANLAL